MTSDATCVPLIARLATKLSSERRELFRYDPVRKVSQIWTGQEWVDTFEARAAASFASSAIRRDGDGRHIG